MNHRALHRTGWLAGLLLLSTLTVPLGHALQHDGVRNAAVPGVSVEAWCDFCHQPFVAFVQDVPTLVAMSFAAPFVISAPKAPPIVWMPSAQPRGPPATS